MVNTWGLGYVDSSKILGLDSLAGKYNRVVLYVNVG